MIPQPLEHLIQTLTRMDGLGKKSAQRAALYMLTHPESLTTLVEALGEVEAHVKTCTTCGNIGLEDPCHVCVDETRDHSTLCVVEGVDDLWALEKSAAYRGVYHVLGGVVSAIDGVGPDDIRFAGLLERAQGGHVKEVILALGASVDGQTTSHLIARKMKELDVPVSTLAKGMPVGAEVDYMDEGTLSLALQGRISF